MRDRRHKLYRATLVAALIIMALFCLGSIARAGDPNGTKTGNRTDVSAPADKGASPVDAALDEVGHNKIAINFVWVFLGGILVFFMQAGFALLETGFCQQKNALHVMMTNFMIFGIAVVAFYFIGFGLMFGGVGALKTLGGAPILTRELSVGGWGLIGAPPRVF